jgi:hypothetical protein
MEISRQQADQLQRNVFNKRKPLPTDTLFESVNQENAVINNPDSFNDIVNLLRIRFKEGQAVYLRGNIPSLKSSQQIRQMFTGKSACCNAPYVKNATRDYTCTKCHNKCQLGTRARLDHSDRVQEYIEENSKQYIDNRPLFLKLIEGQTKPIYVGIYFIRESKHRWDFHNAIQLTADLMTKHSMIPDDDVNNFIPVYLGSHHDKEHSGAIIIVLNTENYQKYLLSAI